MAKTNHAVIRKYELFYLPWNPCWSADKGWGTATYQDFV
jgi:hypothetical protein